MNREKYDYIAIFNSDMVIQDCCSIVIIDRMTSINEVYEFLHEEYSGYYGIDMNGFVFKYAYDKADRIYSKFFEKYNDELISGTDHIFNINVMIASSHISKFGKSIEFSAFDLVNDYIDKIESETESENLDIDLDGSQDSIASILFDHLMNNNNPVHECSACHNTLNRDQYSKTQWRKKKKMPIRCKKCIGDNTNNTHDTENTENECFSCAIKSSESHYDLIECPNQSCTGYTCQECLLNATAYNGGVSFQL